MGPLVIKILLKRYGPKKKTKSHQLLFEGKGRRNPYRKRMHQYWKDLDTFDKEQRLTDQVRNIFKTGKLSEVEIEEIQMKLRQQTLEPDQTTLVSQVDCNNTRKSYTQGVTDKVDVDINVAEGSSK